MIETKILAKPLRGFVLKKAATRLFILALQNLTQVFYTGCRAKKISCIYFHLIIKFSWEMRAKTASSKNSRTFLATKKRTNRFSKRPEAEVEAALDPNRQEVTKKTSLEMKSREKIWTLSRPSEMLP